MDGVKDLEIGGGCKAVDRGGVIDNRADEGDIEREEDFSIASFSGVREDFEDV